MKANEEFSNSDIFVGEGYVGQESIDFTGEDEKWQEIYLAYQNRLIIHGDVSAVESHEVKVGKDIKKELCMVVYFGDSIKGLIPSSESGIPNFDHTGYETSFNRINAYMSKLLMGRSVVFKVKAVDKANNLCLLSRKEALEHMQGVTWSKLKKDDVVKAIVRRVTPYIVYLNIGGIEALLPAKEMSHGWIWDARDLLKVNDNIKVKILSVDKENKKLEISLKALLPDRWANVVKKYSVDGKYIGTVSGIKHYGVFVSFEPGVDALITLPKSEATLSRLKIGSKISVKIKDINNEKRRIQGRLDRLID